MDGKQLRNSILQWAIQGKLVPQDPNDEPASVLLERIREEKARLVKEKKIKRDKNESIIYRGDDNSYYEKFTVTGEVKCIDEEIPFDLPNGWEWCRLGMLCSKFSTGPFGTMVHKSDYTDNGIPLVNPTNIKEQKIVSDNICKVSLFKYEELRAYVLCENDIILARRGDLAKCAIVHKEQTGWLAGTGSFFLHVLGLSLDYFTLIYTSPYTQSYLIGDSVGTTMNNLNQGLLSRLLIPVPPLSEQSRIIAHYQSLMPLVERYSIAQHQRILLDETLPFQINKSILQEAIQGKLVEQNPDDEPASVLLKRIKQEKERLIKEKKIKRDKQESKIFRGDDNKYYENLNGEVTEITDQIPFDIPTSWQWVRLETVCSYIQRGKSPKYSSIKRFPVVAQKCNQWSGFSLEKALFIAPETVQSYQEERILQNGDLLWNSTGLGTLGRMAIYRSDLNPYGWAVADSHVTVIRPMSQIISDYLFSYFASPTVQSVIEDKADGSTKQKELATSTIKGYYVPLPPTKEQMRIVQRIRTLFQSLN